MRAKLALTLGEPAGIGPDICLQLAGLAFPADIIVIGAYDLLKARAALLHIPITLHHYDAHQPITSGQGHLTVLDVPLNAPCTAGTLNVANSPYVIETLKIAHQLCSEKICAALVTGPVHKAIIDQSGIPFSGHTEFLAALSQVDDVLMTFYHPELIVALLTTHYPLNTVSSLITPQRLQKALQLLRTGLLTLFKKQTAKISICGVNPHAGESGLLGNEEQDIVIPVIQSLQQQGFNLEGPLPADTIFSPTYRNQTDAILAMYHDQGLAPMKALYFGDIVNITLGLPYLRTSVDHGTALSLAGTGKADAASLFQAIQVAATLTQEKFSS